MKLTPKTYQIGDYEIFIQPLIKKNMQKLFIDNFGGWSDEVSKKKFFDVVEKGSIQLFFKEKEFIGYVSFEQEKKNSDSVLINDIHIKKQFQNKGLGTQILQEVESKIKENQIKIFVFKNNSAIKFYQKNGFKEIKELSKSHTSVMVKQLN